MGHEGFYKTLLCIKECFYWKNLKARVKEWFKQCDICQRNKYEQQLPSGLLQPLPIPTQVWAEKLMDFVEGLPRSKGKSIILVVVDRITKYSYFLPLAHPYIVETVAQIFFEQVFRLHGMPQSIVYDRDPTFISHFWTELFRLQGTIFNFSSANHPQTDGQTEVVNRTLEMYLRCLTGAKPKDWVSWLPWAKYCYNTSWHSATKITPFEVVYGRPPPNLLSYVLGIAKLLKVEETLSARDCTLEVPRINLVATQNRMKQIYEKHHKDKELAVGD